MVHINPSGLFLVRAVNAYGWQDIPTDMLPGAVSMAVPRDQSWEGSEKQLLSLGGSRGSDELHWMSQSSLFAEPLLVLLPVQ